MLQQVDIAAISPKSQYNILFTRTRILPTACCSAACAKEPSRELNSVRGMHTSEAKQPPSLPDKWLADLLSKALLLEYQQPVEHVKRKSKRKKHRSQSIKSRTAAGLSLHENVGTSSQLALDIAYGMSTWDAGMRTLQRPNSSLDGFETSWHLEDVPVFHLFAQVRSLLGR